MNTKLRSRFIFHAAFLGLLLVGVMRWIWLARVDHDEAQTFGIIHNFIHKLELLPIIQGHFGKRHYVSTGPAVTVPLGMIGALTDINIPLFRGFVFLIFSVVTVFLSRSLFQLKSITVVHLTLFALWLLSMPWEVPATPSSLPLFAGIYGEGFAFVFSAAAVLVSTSTEAKSRKWAWVLGVLAIASKLVAALLLFFPLLYLARKLYKSTEDRKGVYFAIALVAAYQIFLIATLGLNGYLEDWVGMMPYLSSGGGYSSQMLTAFLLKPEQLRHSGVNPWVVISLFAFGFSVLGLSRKNRPSTLTKERLLVCLSSIGLFLLWFVFFSGRGWMRHLWISYALLGFLATAVLAHWRSQKGRWCQFARVSTTLLFLVAFFHGSLLSLTFEDRNLYWRTQKEFSEELGRKYPNANLFVLDWRFAAPPSLFLKRPQINILEYGYRKGDLLLCDTDTGCEEQDFAPLKLCIPKIERAHIGYCEL